MLIEVPLSLWEVLSVLYIARLPVLRREPGTVCHLCKCCCPIEWVGWFVCRLDLWPWSSWEILTRTWCYLIGKPPLNVSTRLAVSSPFLSPGVNQSIWFHSAYFTLDIPPSTGPRCQFSTTWKIIQPNWLWVFGSLEDSHLDTSMCQWFCRRRDT